LHAGCRPLIKDKDNNLGSGRALTGATARRSQQPLKS
jgi:hypothetical protein